MVDHFSKRYYGYLPDIKKRNNKKIGNFFENFGFFKILQTDNGKESKNEATKKDEYRLVIFPFLNFHIKN